MKGRRFGRALAPLAAGLGLLALSAPSASASFHEILVREVYAGFAADPDVEYVELQMYAGGQEFVKDQAIRTYDAAGAPVKANPFPTNVARGSNQSTIVMATPAAESKFGIAADAALSPTGQLDPAGGAVCWAELDCVSWGSFNGGPLPSPAGSPAGAIPEGMALRRTIAPGCATLLEAADDRDNSALDFTAVFPAPRANATIPSEAPCGSTGSGSGPSGPGGGAAASAPQTSFKVKPRKRTRDRTPTFRFGSDRAGSSFQCKLNRRPFRSCRSPFTTGRLSIGRHTFKVRARDRSGGVDPSPASYTFTVAAKRG